MVSAYLLVTALLSNMWCTMALNCGGTVGSSNIAEKAVAVALRSQHGLEVNRSVDGQLEDGVGWGFDGDLPAAMAMFTFSSRKRLQSLTVFTGIGLPDHHITTFRLWTTLVPIPVIPSHPPPSFGDAEACSEWYPLEPSRVFAGPAKGEEVTSPAIAVGEHS